MQFIQNDTLIHANPSETHNPPSRTAARARFVRRISAWLLVLSLGILCLFANPFDLAQTYLGIDVNALFASEFVQSYRATLRYTIALITLIIAPCGLYIEWRQHLARPHYWRTHCPRCQSQQLTRLRRRRRDRVFGALFQLPLYLYQCEDCEWHGRRTDHGHL